MIKSARIGSAGGRRPGGSAQERPATRATPRGTSSGGLDAEALPLPPLGNELLRRHGTDRERRKYLGKGCQTPIILSVGRDGDSRGFPFLAHFRRTMARRQRLWDVGADWGGIRAGRNRIVSLSREIGRDSPTKAGYNRPPFESDLRLL